MFRQDRSLSYRFQSDVWMERSGAGPGGGGYALLILMMFLAILLITLTRVLPDIYTAAQREREEELIFRGNQYARAIALFHQQFNRYPASVDELLKRTNGFRFLRQAFPDPMTPKGKWRFIHVSAAGVVLDSKMISPPSASKNQTGTQSSGPGAIFPSPGSSPGGAQNATPSTGPAGVSPNGELKGAFIVGVASTNPRQSIRIWNGHDHYSEWEFLGLPPSTQGIAVPPSAIPGGTPTPSPATPSNPSTPAANPSSAPM